VPFVIIIIVGVCATIVHVEMTVTKVRRQCTKYILWRDVFVAVRHRGQRTRPRRSGYCPVSLGSGGVLRDFLLCATNLTRIYFLLFFVLIT